jgi:fibronectin type 3 domain-containing protein
MNRSLFVKEYYDHLSWEPDSWNSRFNIAEYRIYRKETGYPEYQLLGSVGADVLAYLDGPVDSTKEYGYVLTSVDSEGRESPRSLPVKAS